MAHVVSIIYFASAIMGAVALGMAVILYLHYRKTVIRRFIIFLSSLFLILLAFLANHYGGLSGGSATTGAEVVRRVFQAAGILVFIGTAPFFYHALMGRTRPRPVVIVLLVVDAAVAGLLAVDTFADGARWAAAGTWVALFSVIAYGPIYGVVNLRAIGDRRLRRALLVFAVLTLLYLPLFVIDLYLGRGTALDALVFMDNLVQPSYFLVLTLLFILFCMRYFNEPVYRQNGKLTPYFVEKFDVSERECEIIQHLLSGENAKEIGDLLFISPKTVENHIYNIYKKCDVRSRVQLYQLIHSNSTES